MGRINFFVALFDWINITISVYLFYKLLYQTPDICINVLDTIMAILSLIILSIARIVKEIID